MALRHTDDVRLESETPGLFMTAHCDQSLPKPEASQGQRIGWNYYITHTHTSYVHAHRHTSTHTHTHTCTHTHAGAHTRTHTNEQTKELPLQDHAPLGKPGPSALLMQGLFFNRPAHYRQTPEAGTCTYLQEHQQCLYIHVYIHVHVHVCIQWNLCSKNTLHWRHLHNRDTLLNVIHNSTDQPLR